MAAWTSVNVAKRGVGIPFDCNKFFANDLLVSILAALDEGPNIFKSWAEK